MLQLMRGLLVLSLANLALAAETPPAASERESPAGSAEKGRADAFPATTPYDVGSDDKQRDLYRRGYRNGHDWALHPERHDHATTNPSERNGAAIHGFIEGWKAGVQAAPLGAPTGDLPSKYARFIAWTPEPDWEAIRAARIKDHDPETAAEFTGRWKMTLPRGFKYDVELALAEGEKGLLEMKAPRGICLLGTYSIKGDRLQLVGPKDKDGIQDFDWQYRDGLFVLESQSVRNSGDYVGAKLERVK